MPSWLEFGNLWKTMRELDLGPIRAEAERVTWIAVVGDDERARTYLVKALCADPRKKLPETDASQFGPEPLSVDLARAPRETAAELVILMVELSRDTARAWSLFQDWHAAGKKIVVLFTGQGSPGQFGGTWEGARGLMGPITDPAFLEGEFSSAVLDLLPDRHLSLARYYPMFRHRAAQHLINTTAMANANYSLTTGLAEIIPILDIPFNVADIVILTKNQALMAYKLGLALGLPPRWQDHMAAFGSAVGTGFVWRQVARQLVGLIPVWGIIPKVAVAYAGTYVLGQAIMQWYFTGRQVTPEMMSGFYRQALDQGRALAQRLRERASRERKLIDAPAAKKRRLPAPHWPRLSAPRLPSLPARNRVKCANCGAMNPAGYKFCGNCGAALE